jgi:AcrR family transcriptional regulator
MDTKVANARDRILAAGLGLLASEGYAALTQTRIAAATGLRQGHLTYYFPRRTDLLQGIAEAAARAVLAAIDAGSGQRRLGRAAIRRLLLSQLDDSGLPRLMLALMAAADEDPAVRAWLVAFQDRMVDGLADHLAAAGVAVPRERVALFHATVVGLRLRALHDPAMRDLHAQVGRAFDLLLTAPPRRTRSPG